MKRLTRGMPGGTSAAPRGLVCGLRSHASPQLEVEVVGPNTGPGVFQAELRVSESAQSIWPRAVGCDGVRAP